MENQWFLVLGESSCSQKAPGDFLSRKCYCCYNEQLFVFKIFIFLAAKKDIASWVRGLPCRVCHYAFIVIFLVVYAQQLTMPIIFFLIPATKRGAVGGGARIKSTTTKFLWVPCQPQDLTFKHIGTWVSACLAERKISSSIAAFDAHHKINQTEPFQSDYYMLLLCFGFYIRPKLNMPRNMSFRTF